MIYPGAIIDGASFESGRYRQLSGGVRKPVDISTDLTGIDNVSMSVNNPNSLSAVRRAINSLILDAGDNAPPLRMSYTEKKLRSASHLAATFGLHSRANALDLVETEIDYETSSEYSTTHSRNMTELRQVFYTVNVDSIHGPMDAYSIPPSISSEVVPVYISSVTYGRIAIIASLQDDTESSYAHDFAAALRLNIDGIAESDNSANVEIAQSAAENFESFQALVNGGGGPPVVVNPATFADYLEAPLVNRLAVPISYTVNRLSDGSPVRTVLTSNYVDVECTPGVDGKPRGIVARPVRFSGSNTDREYSVYGKISVDVTNTRTISDSNECEINTDPENLIFDRSREKKITFPTLPYSLNPLSRATSDGVVYTSTASNSGLVVCAHVTIESGGSSSSIIKEQIIPIGANSKYRIRTDGREIEDITPSLVTGEETIPLRGGGRLNFDLRLHIQAQANCEADDPADCLPHGVYGSKCDSDDQCTSAGNRNLWCDNLPATIDGTPRRDRCVSRLPENRICGRPYSGENLPALNRRCQDGLMCLEGWCTTGVPGSVGTNNSECASELFWDDAPYGRYGRDFGDPRSHVCEPDGTIPVKQACTQNRHCDGDAICDYNQWTEWPDYRLNDQVVIRFCK